MKLNKIFPLLTTLFLFSLSLHAQTFTSLRNMSFADGRNSLAQLLLSGNTIYGSGNGGGSGGPGTIYKMNNDGSGFIVLKNFTTFTNNVNPEGGGVAGDLILSGGVLYGTTSRGGADSGGTIFKMNADGSAFTVLHTFSAADGTNSQAGLTLSGSILYGTCSGGGSGFGTIFKMNLDGSGFTVLHNFLSGSTEGATPEGDLLLSNGVLYGTTYKGGISTYGTVYKMNIDGTGFTLLHSFTGSSTDGRYPITAGLALSGGTLFGTTYSGGSQNLGTVYKMNSDGSGFAVLHSFLGIFSGDGKYPQAPVVFANGLLYGITTGGGSGDKGMVFQMNMDGTGYTALHSFLSDQTEGYSPYGGIIVSNNTLYGTTSFGGANFQGTVFKMDLPIVTTTPAPVLSGPARSGTDFMFNITARGGLQIAVEASTNLTSWTALSTNTVSGSSSANWTYSFTDPITSSTAKRFYRAVVLP